MKTSLLRLALLSLLLSLVSAAPAAAQARQGVYRVTGTEPGRGDYAGQVELRWNGSSYSFVRDVELTTWRYTGRPVSTVWTGTARDVAGGVEVDVVLDRMGWATQAAGLPSRTPSDGAPMTVRGRFDPQGGALGGRFVGQGVPFVDPTETWTLTGPPGAAPIWSSERSLRATHAPPSSFARLLVRLLFGSFRTTPWVAPYTSRPEFQAAITYAVRDRTDFALHRARPDLLRVVQRIADPMNLEEARVKADAFGKTLRAKAEAADLEIPARFVDPTGALHRLVGNNVRDDDGDGCLWTGVYAYSQALRLAATSDPVASANCERTVRALLQHMTITGQPDLFARTLRTASGTAGGRWHAGTGPHAGVEWLETGNNDMLKGLLLGALALHEALPGQTALRAEYGQALGALTNAHSTMKGFRHAGNRAMGHGLTALLQNGGPSRDQYRRLARNPFNLLVDVAQGGGLTYQGQADWSGTHLNICGLIISTRLAQLHRERIVEAALRLALRRAHARLTASRRSLHSIAAAALGGLARAEADDAVWHLREMPFPRARMRSNHEWRTDSCVSPWPNLPWKRDWTTNQGRALLLVHPAAFERHLGNYLWKEHPAPGIQGDGSTDTQEHANDYLFAYWLARAHGVLGPND